MRNVGFVPFAFACVVIASTAWAQCGAIVGTGPAWQLKTFQGCDFDAEYMRLMYQQHMTVAAVAGLGAQRASDESVRDLSEKIVGERRELAGNLARWYTATTGGQLTDPGTVRTEGITCWLGGLSGASFDSAYAEVMVALMRQSMDAADFAKKHIRMAQLREQNGLVWRTGSNESHAFNRWLARGFLTVQQEQRYCETTYNKYDPRCHVVYQNQGPFFSYFPFPWQSPGYRP